MDSTVKMTTIYLQRAFNEISIAELLFAVSNSPAKKQELQIFKDEKWKRGHFTYQTIPQANKEPAEQSINNAVTFLKNIKLIIEK